MKNPIHHQEEPVNNEWFRTLAKDLLYAMEIVTANMGGKFSGNHGDKYFTMNLDIKNNKTQEKEYTIKAYAKVVDTRILNITDSITLTDNNWNNESLWNYYINWIERIEVIDNKHDDSYILEHDKDKDVYYLKKINGDIFMAFDENGDIKYSESTDDVQKYKTYLEDIYAVFKTK